MSLKIPLPAHMLNAAAAVMVGACGMAAAASPLAANEYIPYRQPDCRHVRKSSDGKFSFAQPCSRGLTGEWKQVIESMDLAAPGLI
jgi:hypothetical protein